MLPVTLIDERVEGMEKFFLGRILATDELHIINHQHVDRPELLLEIHRIAFAQCPDEAVHEFLSRQINNTAMRGELLDMPGDGMHEVSLAQPDAAIKEQGIEGNRPRFGHALRSSIGKFVRLTDNKAVEGKARVKCSTDIRALIIPRRRAIGRRRRNIRHRRRRRSDRSVIFFAFQPGHIFGTTRADDNFHTLDFRIFVAPELFDTRGVI